MLVDPLSLFNLEEFHAAPDAAIDTDQRYTPAIEVARVKQYLGIIGLDPCANPQKSVPAVNHITEAQDCLLTDWRPLLAGYPTVFLNPPFSNSLPFLQRMVAYLQAGYIKDAVTLTLSGVLQNASTQPLIKDNAIAVCAPTGRINFIGAKNTNGNDRDVIWICWGADASVERFRDCFDGLVLRNA